MNISLLNYFTIFQNLDEFGALQLVGVEGFSERTEILEERDELVAILFLQVLRVLEVLELLFLHFDRFSCIVEHSTIRTLELLDKLVLLLAFI